MRMKNNRGFTLLELIVVLFIISIILGMSAVFFANTLPSNKFNATVREIVATIRHARSLAQVNSQTETITIDLDAKRYGLEGRAEKIIPPAVYVKVVDTFSGDITTGKCQIIFPAYGGAEGGTIILWDKKKTVTIRLDPVVGSVVTKQLQNARF